MKHVIIFIITTGLTILFLSSCGPGEEELRQQEQEAEQARLDSLERVWEAEMEELRQDSIEQARQDSIAEAEAAAEAAAAAELQEEERTNRIQFDPDGKFTVQVRSWRSEVKAREHAEMWQQRGFDYTYVEQYGNEDVGDVWFRVRIGNVTTHATARQLQESLHREHQTESWIGSSGE